MPRVGGGGDGRVVDLPLGRDEFVVVGQGETAGGVDDEARNGLFPPVLLSGLTAGGNERESAWRGDAVGREGGVPEAGVARRAEGLT